MEHTIIESPPCVLIGLAARIEPATAMETIGSLWARVLGEGALDRIGGRLDRHTLLAAYTDYAGDETAAYTLMLGVPVRDDAVAPSGLVRRAFAGRRVASIRACGVVPDVVRRTWSEVHASSLDRTFTVDYERYDRRTMGPQTPIELWIAVR